MTRICRSLFSPTLSAGAVAGQQQAAGAGRLAHAPRA
ncbi:hypothetical protein ABH931_001007 [Streptacidiphilus sp. MAP12-33]